MELETLFPVLDILLAATLCAWFTAFATSASADRATRSMLDRAERVRMGAFFIMVGMFTNLAALSIYLVGEPEASTVMDFFAYPLWIAGAVSLASATWTSDPAPEPEGVRA